jgi:hypothetical protein
MGHSARGLVGRARLAARAITRRTCKSLPATKVISSLPIQARHPTHVPLLLLLIATANIPYAGTQVFSTGQTTAHCGASKCPSHSVHFFGSMMYMSPLRRMAALGHSNSQAPHTVHCEAMIL